MGHAAYALLIIGQPLTVLGVVLGPPAVMARRGFSAPALLLWAGALALLTTWGVVTHRLTVRTQATGEETDLLVTAPWLLAAGLVAVASVLASVLASVVAVRRRERVATR